MKPKLFINLFRGIWIKENVLLISLFFIQLFKRGPHLRSGSPTQI